MLDYAFANYKTVTPQAVTVPAQTLLVELGLYDEVQTQPITLNFTPLLVPAAVDPVVETDFTVQPSITAPMEQGRPDWADYRNPEWGKPSTPSPSRLLKRWNEEAFGPLLALFGSRYLACKT